MIPMKMTQDTDARAEGQHLERLRAAINAVPAYNGDPGLPESATAVEIMHTASCMIAGLYREAEHFKRLAAEADQHALAVDDMVTAAMEAPPNGWPSEELERRGYVWRAGAPGASVLILVSDKTPGRQYASVRRGNGSEGKWISHERPYHTIRAAKEAASAALLLSLEGEPAAANPAKEG